MMRPPDSGIEVFVCVEPVDFRKQIDGLAAIVQEELALNAFGGQLFVFTNRRRDRVKCLYWERCGFVLWMKRLERQRFTWPRSEDALVSLSGEQLNYLLDGYNLGAWQPHQPLHFSAVA